jgi:Secretion system C-terminal sorting domain
MKHIYFRNTLMITSLLAAAWMPASAQYYPAGLGNTNLSLWLTAADPTTLQNPSGSQANNGDFIAQWKDKSGNNHHAVQATSGTQPVLKTNALNGNSAVIIQNTSQLMTGPAGAYQTIVGVRNMSGSGGHYQYFFSSPANADFSVRGGGAGTSYTDGPNNNDWSFNTGTPPLEWTNGVQTLTSSNTNHIIIATAAAQTNHTYSISSTFLTRGMTGNDPVYEILAYSTPLSTTQRQLLENYEASTWNLESQLPTSGYTIFTPPVAASFNKNLVGIGYTSATDNVLSVASGVTDGLGFSSTSTATGFLSAAGFLMAAHNGQSNTVISPATVHGITSTSILNLWNRSWYVQKSGGNATGQVTINFNFTDYNGSTPSATATFALLYNSTDGTFATGTNAIVPTSSTTISGGTVSFAVSASSLSNGYYSVLYSTSPIVLPLTITDFTVSGNEGAALLDWMIQDGAGIDHFNVQRSTDGANFTSIGAVQAQTNASANQEYTFTDSKPAAGTNYYRIEAVSTDGSLAYSAIRTLDGAANPTVSINMYPVPASDVLHILTAGTGPLSILIIDAQGRVMLRTNAVAGNTTDVSVSKWPKGIYFAEIVDAQSKYARPFIKE